MAGEEKKTTTQEKHPGRVAQAHRLAAFMKKRKEEVLRDKEQFPVHPTVQSTDNHSVQSTVQSNGAYVYDFGTLATLAIGVCVYLHMKLLGLQTKNKPTKNRINHKNDVICFRSDEGKNIQQMSSFDWKKNVEESIKDGLIITVTVVGIFFALKAAVVKPIKTSLDAMGIMKLIGGICGGVLVKDYTV